METEKPWETYAKLHQETNKVATWGHIPFRLDECTALENSFARRTQSAKPGEGDRPPAFLIFRS